MDWVAKPTVEVSFLSDLCIEMGNFAVSSYLSFLEKVNIHVNELPGKEPKHLRHYFLCKSAGIVYMLYNFYSHFKFFRYY